MNLPRVIIAGTSSGSGKTTAACAILKLLRRLGLDVRAAKCGPDYIDPMFHKAVLGVPGVNLDPFFCGGGLINHILRENSGQGVTVIEGVMGYYDGTGIDGTDNSTYTVAEETDTPVILAVDGRGASASLIALVEGFLRFREKSHVAGVIFNSVTPPAYTYLKRLMERRFGGDVLAVGYIPRLPEDCVLASRHLGLVTADEVGELAQKLERLADICEGTIDLDALLSIAGRAGALRPRAPEIRGFPPLDIAVARDRAFCFYYEENLRLLEGMGARLVPFSPLDNEPVPESASGLYIGGGYPELYAGELEKNEASKKSAREAVLGGMPTIAECGGFQYLGKSLDGRRMCGVFEHESYNTGRLVRFGYVTLESEKPGLFGPPGVKIRGHEFHYYDSTDCGDGFYAGKINGQGWKSAVYGDTIYAGYPHLYFYSNIPAAEAFYRACLRFRSKGEEGT